MTDPFDCHPGQSTIALAVALPVVDIIAVSLRFHIRRHFKVGLAADDWSAAASLLLLLGLAAILLVAASYQVLSCPSAPNTLEVAASHGDETPHIAWSFYLISVAALGSVKMAFTFCMRRIFLCGEERSAFQGISLLLMGLVITWTISFTAAIIAINVDSLPSGRIVDWGAEPATLATDRMFFAMAVSDVVLDVFIAVAPILTISKLHMSTARKFAVNGILLVRLLALCSSIVRMVYTIAFSQWMNNILDIDPSLKNPSDQITGMNLNRQMMWWTFFEVGVGLLANCLVTIQQLLRKQHIQSFCIRASDQLGLRSAAAASEPTVTGSSAKLAYMPQSSTRRSSRPEREDDGCLPQEERMIGFVGDQPADYKTLELEHLPSPTVPAVVLGRCIAGRP